MFCVKIHQSSSGKIVAICDESLVGKVLMFGDTRIDVSHEFYCEKVCDIEEIFILFQEATCLNLLGENIVSLAIQHGLVHEESVIYLETDDGKKVPYAIVQLFAL